MATYKLIQDIEAEDHILGPLTLRQFIFSLIAVFFLYISFICLTKGAAFLLVLFLPPALFFGFFALPFGKDQPTEIWALAKIRYFIKPRRRIWDQSGVKELVTITVPKKIEQVLTDGLSQTEVKSRLQALANTIDSRGWVIKNVNVNAFSQPNPLMLAPSDRLIDIGSIPQQVPNYDVQAADDILDETSNPVARQFDSMINASSEAHRLHLVNELNSVAAGQSAPPAQPADYWFMNPGADKSQPAAVVVQPGSGIPPLADQAIAPAEAALAADLKARSDSQQVSYARLRTLQPLGTPSSSPTAGVVQAAPPAVTAKPDPAILSLANNNDLNVATLAREAHRARGGEGSSNGEVVISLH